MLKSILVASLFIASSWANAEVVPFPENLCRGVKCGAKQARIYNRFVEKGMSPLSLQREAVYSGACHWVGSSFSPEQEHHAGIFIYAAPDGEAMSFRGRFSFFAAENPYRDFDAETARRAWFANPKDPVLEMGEEFGFYDANKEGEMRNRIWYWFRADSVDPNLLYVVTLWGYSDYGVCELTLN